MDKKLSDILFKVQQKAKKDLFTVSQAVSILPGIKTYLKDFDKKAKKAAIAGEKLKKRYLGDFKGLGDKRSNNENN